MIDAGGNAVVTDPGSWNSASPASARRGPVLARDLSSELRCSRRALARLVAMSSAPGPVNGATSRLARKRLALERAAASASITARTIARPSAAISAIVRAQGPTACSPDSQKPRRLVLGRSESGRSSSP